MFLRFLIVLVISVTLNLGRSAQEDPTFYARSGGTKVIEQDLVYYLVQIPKDVHRKLSISREVQGNKVESLKKVNSDLAMNQEYLSDWIAMAKSQILTRTGKMATEEQAFVAMFMGIDKFEKIGFNPDRVKDEAIRVRLDVFKGLLGSQALIPPPLPTDGRKPIPTRYPDAYKNQPRVVLGTQG